MDTKVSFTEKEIKKAIDFARSIKWKHGCFSDKANKNIDNRTDAEVYVSILRGKLAEIALKKYLQEKHKDSKHKITGLDFNIYKRGIISCTNVQNYVFVFPQIGDCYLSFIPHAVHKICIAYF